MQSSRGLTTDSYIGYLGLGLHIGLYDKTNIHKQNGAIMGPMIILLAQTTCMAICLK